MNVLILVSVARGTSGSPSISSLSALARPLHNCFGFKFFLLEKYNGCFLEDFPIFGPYIKKKERKAMRENIITAIQASDSCQNIVHVRSKISRGGIRIADVRTKPTIIIMADKQMEAPMASFWPSLILTRQSSWIGMVITKRNLRISLQNS